MKGDIHSYTATTCMYDMTIYAFAIIPPKPQRASGASLSVFWKRWGCRLPPARQRCTAPAQPDRDEQTTAASYNVLCLDVVSSFTNIQGVNRAILFALS